MLNQNNKIIILIIILFVISSVFLFISENYYKSTTGSDWWAVYFENPKDSSLKFTIENKDAEADFHWELWLGEKKVQEGKETIEKNNKKTIEPDKNPSADYRGKINVKISSEEEKREIYKNLSL